MGLFFGKREDKQRTVAPDNPPQKIVGELLSAPSPAVCRMLSYHVANLQGIGTRQEQQDSFSFVNGINVSKMKQRGLLAIVADGMGGMKDGRIAGEMTVDSIKASFEQFDYDADFSEQLFEALRDANDRVFRALDEEGGSTAVVCFFFRGKLWYASVGDSYLFLLRNKQLCRINRPHTLFSLECEKQILRGSVDTHVADSDPEKDALARFIGMEDIEDIDGFVRPMTLSEGDVIMLCSDGVAGVLDPAEIRDCLSLSAPDKMCRGLEQCILEKQRHFQDNYTALIIRCEY